MMECPRCHHTLRDTARFCDGCGLSIGSLEQATRELDGLAATEPADQLLGKIVDRKYRVTEALGRGGMGVVYRATRVNIGDEVALKVLRREFVAEPETVQRFRREAKAAAMLRHPNIVVIHDYGEAGADGNADAPAYIVMELVVGASLGDIVREEKHLDVERAVRLMRGICAGVGAAHRRDIVHRDLKPDNVIVLPPDEEEDREQETVKVVDFGIAKLRDPARSFICRRNSVAATSWTRAPMSIRSARCSTR